MRCLLAVAFAVVLVVAEGKVLPASDVGSQQTATQNFQLTDYIREAQNAITTFSDQIRDKINSNQDEFVNTVKEHSNTLVSNIQQYVQNVTEEIKNKNPELESTWTNFKNKLNEVVDKVTITPETTEQVNQLRTRFQEGLQTLITESENTAKTINENSGKLQEDIAKFTKNAIDIAVQASQNLNNQLQQAATQPQS